MKRVGFFDVITTCYPYLINLGNTWKLLFGAIRFTCLVIYFIYVISLYFTCRIESCWKVGGRKKSKVKERAKEARKRTEKVFYHRIAVNVIKQWTEKCNRNAMNCWRSVVHLLPGAGEVKRKPPYYPCLCDAKKVHDCCIKACLWQSSQILPAYAFNIFVAWRRIFCASIKCERRYKTQRSHERCTTTHTQRCLDGVVEVGWCGGCLYLNRTFSLPWKRWDRPRRLDKGLRFHVRPELRDFCTARKLQYQVISVLVRPDLQSHSRPTST